MTPLTAVILAAGQGTRMRSPLPKVLQPVGGRPLLVYPLQLCADLRCHQTIVVVGTVQQSVEPLRQILQRARVTTVVQDPPLGTGHAVLTACRALGAVTDDLLILYGDMPFIRRATIDRMVAAHRAAQAVLTFATAPLSDLGATHGRVLRDARGEPMAVVEVRDATPEQHALTEVNVGIYLAQQAFLQDALTAITPSNTQREYYLTDVIAVAARLHQRMATVSVTDPIEACGINTAADLALANRFCRQGS